MDQEDIALLPAAQQQLMKPGAKKQQLKRMRRELEVVLSKPIMGTLFSYNHPRSKASIAAVMRTHQDNLPDSLVGINPTENLIAEEDSQDTYKDRYAKELFGDAPFEPGVDKIDAYDAYRKQRKQIQKLTKKLLKPERMVREDAKKAKEKKKELKSIKAAKKREKRRKRKAARTQ